MDIPEPTIALCDIDQLVYAVACQVEGKDEPDSHILHTAKLMLNKRINEVTELYPTVKTVHLFISDKNNFRKRLARETPYKGSRREKPEDYNFVRDYYIKRGAKFLPWLEADDYTAMNHWASFENGSYQTVLVDQDKDLDQVPGHRLIPSLSRGGKVIREAKRVFITLEEAHRSFYQQLLTGDNSDDIEGISGIGGKTAQKLLANAQSEYEMFSVVVAKYFEVYGVDMTCLFERAQLLYLRKFPNDCYLPPRRPRDA